MTVETEPFPSSSDNAVDEMVLQPSQIFKACSTNDLACLKGLLESGADIFITNDLGQWPLHVSAAMGYLEPVKLLLQHAHPWNCIDGQGMTAGELAKQNGHAHVYDYLVEEGVRAELIFGMLGRHSQDMDAEAEADAEDNKVHQEQHGHDALKRRQSRTKTPSNAEYLSSKNVTHSRFI